MQLKLEEISKENKDQLRIMLFDYFKEIDNSKIIRKGDQVIINYPYLDTYWTASNRIPLNIFYNNELAGFVLINAWIICKEFNAQKSIAEFYIKPAYRRKGIGKAVAFHLFRKYHGKWEVRQLANNFSAVKFWRTTIKEFTNGNFEELKKGEGEKRMFIQLFES